MKHGVLGTINVRTAVLKNACINTDCAWHTCHWSGLYENGCYMLKDNSECISGEKMGFMSVEQYIKEENEIKQIARLRSNEGRKVSI